MSKKIKLAIVGRPNVGKSALFNRICNRRIAIVDDAAGITRDRLYSDADFFGHPFQVIDTGGMDSLSDLPFQEEVRMQAEIAIEEADAIIMVVDGQVGVTVVDEIVARSLLKTKKRVILAVNKVDDYLQMDFIHPFYKLGISSIIPVSAVQGFQIAELLESAFEGIEWPTEPEPEDKTIKIAIIGRPNVGKSTLVNYLLQEQRCVVSPIAGTTRDSVDTQIEKDGQIFTLIDTAGIRRKRAEHEVVDKFAAIRTERAIARADICILLMDSSEGITTQEKRIADQIEEAGKGCLLLFNKWDLVKGFRMEHCLQGIRSEASFLNYCPTLFVSALDGRNLNELFPLLLKVNEQRSQRITTGQLNKFIEQVFQRYHPPMIRGKRLRVYYMAQVQASPPRFVMFVNFPDLMLDSYRKYLINQFREEYEFTGVPLVFDLKGKNQRDSDEVKETTKTQTQAIQLDSEEGLDESSDKAFEAMPDLQEEFDSSYF